MERDIVVIVARQLKEAQDKHAHALRVFERIQRVLNKKAVRLRDAGQRLIDIEEIHDLLVD